MCYYNFYLEAKENLIWANFDYKQKNLTGYTARNRLVPFFRGTESLIPKN